MPRQRGVHGTAEDLPALPLERALMVDKLQSIERFKCGKATVSSVASPLPPGDLVRSDFVAGLS